MIDAEIRRKLETDVGRIVDIASLSGMGVGQAFKIRVRSGNHYYLRIAGDAGTLRLYTGQGAAEALEAEYRATDVLYRLGYGPKPLAITEKYFLREYVDGQRLDRCTEHLNGQAAPIICRAVDFVASVVRTLLSRGERLWLDLTPDNIILGADDRFYLIDHEWAALRIYDYEQELGRRCGELFSKIFSSVSRQKGFLDSCLLEFGANCGSQRIFNGCLQALDAAYRTGSGKSTDQRWSFLSHAAESSLLRDYAATVRPGIPSLLLVHRLLAECNRSGALYTLGRPYDLSTADTTFHRKDLDLFVRREDLGLLRMALRAQGFIARSPTVFYQYCPVDQRLLYVDVHAGDLTISGRPYLHLDDVVGRRTFREGLPFPNAVDLFLVDLLQPLFVKGVYTSSGWNRMQSVIEIQEIVVEVQRELSKLFGSRLTDELLHSIKHGIPEEICRMRSQLVRRLAGQSPAMMHRLRHAANRLQIYTSRYRGELILRALRRLLYRLRHTIRQGRKSHLIAFIGMDGAGKTTSVKRVRAALEANGVPCQRIYLGGLNLATGRINTFAVPYDKLVVLAQRVYRWIVGPALRAQLPARPLSVARKENTPTWRAPAMRIFERLLLPLAVLDALLYSVVLAVKARLGPVLLADRYFYDLRATSGSRFIGWSLNFVARPAITFYLYTDPEIHQERRAARPHSLPDIIAGQAAYESLPRIIRGITMIPIRTESYERVEEIIISQLVAKRVL